ncbi:sugar ABC transporter permease [Paenibacillus pectinilyticus]|uniref:Sugar ABC transporter permease n=1 Tax=Paenibacillus pectinilyticus TaxID=512399 RepID=A0A1C0ZXF8_9BACL|nr:carbohydrate ABC transporter permease [Paenibacillus pectinilyticus]OCT12790.1 sugar ABC transporter permease [Paenibacillus pectinilyticus]
MRNNKLSQYIWICVGALLAVMFIFPIYIMIISSLKPVTQIFDLRLIPDTITFSNYLDIFTKQKFQVFVLNSSIISVSVTVISLLIHSMSAFALARLRFPGRKFIFLLILSTMMIPFSVIMIPLFITVRSLGLTNNLLGVILPSIPSAFGIFLLNQFLLGIPTELEEAAKVDGASLFRIYRSIALPLSKPILSTLAAMYFIGNWNNYLWPLIVTPGRKFWVIQVAIANFKGEHAVEWNLILAASVVASLPVIVLFIFFQRYLVEGIKMTGIKD